MKTIFALALGIILILPSGAGGGQSQSVSIVVRNSSGSRCIVSVRDDVLCAASQSLPKRCQNLKAIVDSNECKSNRYLKKCKEARAILKKRCVKGTVFSGWVEPDATVQVNVCPTNSGRSNLSVRKGESGFWHNHMMLSPGATVSVK